MTHTSTTAPAQLFDPELLYNILMGAIEPELCTDVFPTLDDVYKDETEEGRNVRMERYDVAVKNFKKRAAEFSADFQNVMWKIGDDAMKIAQENQEIEDATHLRTTEDSLAQS